MRNKWKCTFKDGMIHINGKDYLFAKCTGSVQCLAAFLAAADLLFSEFEW